MTNLKEKRKTHNSKKLAVAILLMTSIAVVIVAVQPTQAQLAAQQPVSGPLPSGVTVDGTTDTEAFLSARPTVIGLGQPILVNVWCTPAPGADRMLLDYKITIVKPDGTTDVKTTDSRWADGTAWFEYIADQIGTWKFKFDFPGTYEPTGRYYQGNIITNTTGGTFYNITAYYKPASTPEQTVTVQQGMVPSWPPAPLPTGYWTRPVSPMNREWYSISGNYPWPYGNDGYDYAGPFVSAPNSAHIVWKRQQNLNGLAGGELGSTMIGSTQTTGYGYPSVIYWGRAYQTMTLPIDGMPTSCAACYDIRTGETYYARPIATGGITPTDLAYGGSSGPGPATTPELLSIGTQLIKINPWTGAITANVTGMSGTFHNGCYVLSVQTNNTAIGRRLINWTTSGSSSNFQARIISNISWPWTNLGTCQDFNVGIAVQISGITQGGIYVGQTINAANLKTGLIVWNTTIDDPLFSGSCNVADNGMVAVHTAKGYFKAFDLLTGRQVWQSETFDYPWDEPGFGAYDIASAYGLIYRSAYSAVYAVNWTNGKIQWKYESPNNPFETPYIDANGTTVNSWNGGILVADGKVYDYNTEHSPTDPLTRGWKLHCINATTGEGIWQILGMSTSRSFSGAAADGYLAFDDLYDAYLYVFGKGKTTTTVTAPDVFVPLGTGITIKGTVLDMSPAQTNTPCVSKDSMELQMEYLHMQMPIDGLWHNETLIGVPVAISAITSDGTVIDIGTTTTSGYYGTFEMPWTPSKEGTYKIIASFNGDDSYGSSGASTAVSIGPAPTSTDTGQQQKITVPDYTMTIVYAAIAIIIAVVISVVIVGIVLYRKK